MADNDPDALERKIERTRAELARTVDAIADRVSPKRVAGRNVAKVKAQAEHVVASIGDFLGASGQPSNGAVHGFGPAGHPPNGLAPATAEDGQDLAEAAPPPNLAPILIGVGVVLAVSAAIVVIRRRRRK